MRPWSRLHAPMLAYLDELPQDRDGYLYEPKLDGIRCLAYGDETPSLVGRNFKEITDRFPEVELPRNCVLDGELVVYGPDGVPDFQLIQPRITREVDIAWYAERYPAVYVPFDILEWRNRYVGMQPLIKRKGYLAEAYSEPLQYQLDGGLKLLDTLAAKGWEGVMAKAVTSQYKEGKRRKDWLKWKVRTHRVVTVIGYAQGVGRRQGTFGALLVADTKTKAYLGEVGTGFDDEELVSVYELLCALRRDHPLPGISNSVAVRPLLRVHVSYIEVTNDGRLRHPAYEGLVQHATKQ